MKTVLLRLITVVLVLVGAAWLGYARWAPYYEKYVNPSTGSRGNAPAEKPFQTVAEELVKEQNQNTPNFQQVSTALGENSITAIPSTEVDSYNSAAERYSRAARPSGYRGRNHRGGGKSVRSKGRKLKNNYGQRQKLPSKIRRKRTVRYW